MIWSAAKEATFAPGALIPHRSVLLFCELNNHLGGGGEALPAFDLFPHLPRETLRRDELRQSLKSSLSIEKNVPASFCGRAARHPSRH